MSIVVTGATGRIGQATMALLKQTGAPIHVLTRHLARATDMYGTYAAVHEWHPLTSPPPATAFKGAEVVINLMGEPVSGRWSRIKQQRVIASRVGGTAKVVHAVRDNRIRLVNASSFGIYPGVLGEAYNEATPLQSPTNAVQTMIQDWEQAALRARQSGHSVAVIRYGMIAGTSAYPQALVQSCKRGRAMRLGDGSQTVPLIDIDDAARLTVWAATVPDIEGPINAVAPSSISLEKVMDRIEAATGRTARIKLPGWAARTWLGPSAPYQLGSYDIAPQVAQRGGFQFATPEADAILDNAVGHHTSPPPKESPRPRHLEGHL